MMIPIFDVVVIGAGPAGMQAALQASQCNLRVLIVDDQGEPGGQIYRGVLRSSETMNRLLGSDYTYGKQLAESLVGSRVERYFETSVWDISQDLVITLLTKGVTRSVRAKQIIAATGAMERASPVPGWTLPGVMSAGAAQVAMKADASIPSGRIVIAGCGPLMLLVANQLIAAGAQVVAVIDTGTSRSRRASCKHILGALRCPSYLVKGLSMMASLKRHKIVRFKSATDLQVLGTDKVNGFSFRSGKGAHVIEADVVLLHHGVVPNHQISQLLRVRHRWNDLQRAWTVDHDRYGQTSHPAFRMAGDGLSIAGARAASATGALAALGAAHALGALSDDQLHDRARPWEKVLRMQRAVRPFLDTFFQPPEWICLPADNTVVCRCENVTAGDVRRMADIGCTGPNQTKFFSRCGMGPCQGRVCANVVTQLIAERRAKSPDEVGTYRVRSPLKPLSLDAIASCADADRASA